MSLGLICAVLFVVLDLLSCSYTPRLNINYQVLTFSLKLSLTFSSSFLYQEKKSTIWLSFSTFFYPYAR